jgi:hypothetical protein
MKLIYLWNCTENSVAESGERQELAKGEAEEERVSQVIMGLGYYTGLGIPEITESLESM